MQSNSGHWPVTMEGTGSVTIKVCSLIQATGQWQWMAQRVLQSKYAAEFRPLASDNGRHRECYNQSMQPNSGHWPVAMEGTGSVTIKVCSLIQATGQWQWKAQGVLQSKYAA